MAMDLWADPSRLAARATRWGQEIRGLSTAERTTRTGVIGRVPALFAKRPVVLAHRDFAPVNMLRMLELLAGDTSLDPDIQRIVAARLRAQLR